MLAWALEALPCPAPPPMALLFLGLVGLPSTGQPKAQEGVQILCHFPLWHKCNLEQIPLWVEDAQRAFVKCGSKFLSVKFLARAEALA